MIIQTRNFGELNIRDTQIITFTEGLLGFPSHKKFVLIDSSDDPNDYFHWLQSVEDGDIAFLLMNVNGIFPDYEPDIDESDIASISLNDKDGEIFLIYNVTVIPPNDPENMRVNLKAPIIVNSASMKGKQVLVEEDYDIRRNILKELTNKNKLESR